MTLTDEANCSTEYVSAGQTPYCNGSSIAVATAAVDTKPPKLKLSGKKAQKAGKTVKVKARCDENCNAKATGKGLKSLKKKLKAGKRKTLKLKLKGSTRRAAKSAGKVKVKVKVKATDDSGNKAKAKRKLKLKG